MPLGDRKTFKVALVTFGTPATIRKSAKLYGVYTVRGGARRNRTADLFNAIEALSQLSYGPEFFTARPLPLGRGGVVQRRGL